MTVTLSTPTPTSTSTSTTSSNPVYIPTPTAIYTNILNFEGLSIQEIKELALANLVYIDGVDPLIAQMAVQALGFMLSYYRTQKVIDSQIEYVIDLKKGQQFLETILPILPSITEGITLQWVNGMGKEMSLELNCYQAAVSLASPLGIQQLSNLETFRFLSPSRKFRIPSANKLKENHIQLNEEENEVLIRQTEYDFLKDSRGSNSEEMDLDWNYDSNSNSNSEDFESQQYFPLSELTQDELDTVQALVLS